MKKMRTRSGTAFALLVALVFIAAAFFFSIPKGAHSSSGTPITGYAWSDTIGWISLNCSTDPVGCSGPSGAWGLSVDGSGNITGDAWSDSIGWISANPSDLTGCPSSPCTATIGSGGAWSGWFKALAADNNGWDGWISLSGANYGINLSNLATSYAWGSDVVGWVSFANATSTYNQCTPSYTCTGSGGQTITYTNSSCQQSTVTTCVSPNYCSTGSSVCLVPQIQYNPSSGTDGTSTIALTGNLQIIPTILQGGESAQVYWNVSNVTSCSVTGTNGDSWSTDSSPTNGATTSAILSQTIYTLACTGYTGANPPSVTENVTVNISPKFNEQ